ncbi:glutamate receptor -like [Olea europaea subsp. europaea]|uniref:Glutamate receptor -like n=1 Tax=Olea europaea subsp. europaea TaxID=158383 RepID=A0A8S0RU12_OLEEU|nr:glutamate receptor -like [Olea europaea subsp. europaea]
MKMKMHGVILFLLFCEFHGQPYPDASQDSHQETKTIKIGLILDSKSWLGKVVNSCISMAISDFYTLNGQYKTRIALETRDLRGEPLNFLAAAFDLLENAETHAIIVPEMSSEQAFLATLCDKANEYSNGGLLYLSTRTTQIPDKFYLIYMTPFVIMMWML